MATVSASQSLYHRTIFKPNQNPNTLYPTISCSLPIRLQLPHRCINIPNFYNNSSLLQKRLSNLNKIRSSVAEEETVVPEQESSSNQEEVEPTVTVPVSRSDMLTMFFKVIFLIDELMHTNCLIKVLR